MITLFFARSKEDDFVPVEKKHLTAAQVQKLLPCSKRTLIKLRKAGDVIAFQKGRFSFSYPPDQFTAEYIQKKQAEKQKLGLKKK